MSEQPYTDTGSGLPILSTRKFDHGRAISEAYAVTFAFGGRLLLVLLVLNLLASAAVEQLADASWSEDISSLVTMLLNYALIHAYVAVVRARAADAELGFGEALGQARRRIGNGLVALVVNLLGTGIAFLPTILAALVFDVFVVMGMVNSIALVIIFIINVVIALRWSLLVPLVVFEGRYFAFSRSAALMAGKTLALFLVFLSGTLQSVVIAGVIGGIGAMAAVGPLVGGIILAVGYTYSTSFLINLLLSAYQLIREEKEGGSEEQIAEVFS